MRFKSRGLLRVISVVLGSLVLGLLIAIAALALMRDDGRAAEGGIFAFLLLLPGLFVAKLISDSFSVLEVDDKGIRLRRLVGGKNLEWATLGSVRYGERIQLVHGAPSREYFIEMSGLDGRRLLRLKSTFEPAAYAHLLAEARSRNIKVDLG